jgi:hypothetical protein
MQRSMTIPYCSHILYNLWIFCFLWERFEDTKWVIRIRKSKNRQNNDQKEKVQKDKQRSTKHTHKTKDRVTRTPLKTGGELGCFGRVSNSCSTNGNRRVNLVDWFCLFIYLWVLTFPWKLVRSSVILLLPLFRIKSRMCKLTYWWLLALLWYL